tara:strand:+ start:5682 stop:5825 length:144 start_codon:yes stop_codon:yes gene_type:complete
MKKRVTKEPYEGYALPAVSERGGQFVDFNKTIKHTERKPVKKVLKKR